MKNLRSMMLFVRVIDLGSFSKAAIDAGIGQPSVTKIIAQLETRLGCRLLYRSTRGVTPTEVGSAYYQKCRLILQHVEEAESDAGLMHSQLQGGIRVSATTDFGRRVLGPLTFRFLKENPKLHIELLFDDTIVNLVEQRFDLAIRIGRLADSTLGSRFLGQNRWSIVASPAYLAEHGEPKTPTDLTLHSGLIISSIHNDSRLHLVGKDEQMVSVQLKGSFRSNHKSTLLDAARAGLGIAALPTYIVHHSIGRGEVVPILLDWNLPRQEIHAIYPSPRLVPAKVSGFVGWLQAQLGDEWWADRY